MEQKNLFLLLKSALNYYWFMTKKVFVSGCYDLLHSGHVEFFQQASRYGDLYVGIGSDATYLALVVKDSNKFVENHDEAIHLQIRRA